MKRDTSYTQHLIKEKEITEAEMIRWEEYIFVLPMLKSIISGDKKRDVKNMYCISSTDEYGEPGVYVNPKNTSILNSRAGFMGLLFRSPYWGFYKTNARYKRVIKFLYPRYDNIKLNDFFNINFTAINKKQVFCKMINRKGVCSMMDFPENIYQSMLVQMLLPKIYYKGLKIDMLKINPYLTDAAFVFERFEFGTYKYPKVRIKILWKPIAKIYHETFTMIKKYRDNLNSLKNK